MDAAEINHLVQRGLADVGRHELSGGDAVGTDAYPALRDARPALVDALRSADVDVRMAAGHALAFLVEHASETQGALDAALAAAQLPVERASMILAAARLRTTFERWRGVERPHPWRPVPLDPVAAREPNVVVKGALAIAQVWAMSPWGRKVSSDVGAALDALAGVACGPWGDGDLGRLASALRATAYVADPEPVREPADADDRGDDDLNDEERAVAEQVAAAIARAEAAMLARGHDRAGEDDEEEQHGEEQEEEDEDYGDEDYREDGDADFGDDEVDDPYSQDRPERQPPRVVLPGLRDVPWSELEHAYGRATGVPAMIDALSSPDPEDREWAIDALFASINHQGSVYSASKPAVPFLLALAARPDIEGRDGIVRLIAGLAVGDPRWWLVAELENAGTPALAAVSEGASILLPLLAEPDATLRGMTAHALSFVVPPEGSEAAVERALEVEHDRYTRSSLLLALGYISRRTKRSTARPLLERYLSDSCPLLAGSAAIAIAQIDGAQSAQPVRDALARTILEAPPVVGPWPWNGGDVAGFARIVRVSLLTVDDLLDECDGAIARSDTASAQDYATKALWLGFRDAKHGPDRPWLTAELDARQKRTLRTLIALAPDMSDSAFPTPVLPLSDEDAHAVGLPGSRVAAVARLLGDETGASERLVDIAGERWPVWLAIDTVAEGRLANRVLLAALADVPASEQIATLTDALDGPYSLSHSRRPWDYSNADAYERANDRASAFILTMAELVEGCSQAGLEFAQGLVDAQVPLGRNRDAIRALIGAIVLARAASRHGGELRDVCDALVVPLQAPASTYVAALRELFAHLSPARRERLLEELHLYTYQAYRDPRGEVRRWTNGRRWALLDLLPEETRVTEVLAALREWERHRGAGDDALAEPLGGITTSSQCHQPRPDEPFPRDQAIELLTGSGSRGRAVIMSALAAGDIADRALLDEALSRLDAAGA